ncbi:MAG: hypothetical protein IPJ65_25205 [Archangiaceae bacterium]|nr:hypothetical protein [Archangiaceae bacterium]
MQLPSKTAETVAAAVRAGAMTPNDGLSDLMQDAVNTVQRPVRGWQFTASSLDEVSWPDELFDRPNLQVTMTIAPYKSPDLPWTQYLFLLVLFEGAGTQA